MRSSERRPHHRSFFCPPVKLFVYLVPLLNDNDEFPRREAAYALGTVASPDAAAPLLRRLGDEKIPEVKTAIVAALGKCGNPIAIEPLTAYPEKNSERSGRVSPPFRRPLDRPDRSDHPYRQITRSHTAKFSAGKI